LISILIFTLGVVFPRSTTNNEEIQVEDTSEESGRSENGERLSN